MAEVRWAHVTWCVSVHVDRARLCVQLCDWVCYHLGGDQETREISSTIRFLKAFERKWAVLCWTDDRTVSLEAVWSVIELNLAVFVRRYNRASGCEYNDVNGGVPRNTPVKNKHVKPVPVSLVCFMSWLENIGLFCTRPSPALLCLYINRLKTVGPDSPPGRRTLRHMAAVDFTQRMDSKIRRISLSN